MNRKAFPVHIRVLWTAMMLAASQAGLANPGDHPQQRYEIIAEGAVIHDRETGLQWMRCSVGQTWDQDEQQCSGEVHTYSWRQAQQLDEPYLGFFDWRLPTLSEMHPLLDCAELRPLSPDEPDGSHICRQPAEKAVASARLFPQTAPMPYWTATAHEERKWLAWYVHFGIGLDYWGHKSLDLAVRLVRRNKEGKLIKQRYKELVNGSVIADTDTGLQWMRCSVGQQWDQQSKRCSGEAKTYGWNQAEAVSITYAGLSDWRLPRIAELRSIVHCTTHRPFHIGVDAGSNGCQGPAAAPVVVSEAFPGTPAGLFWSATLHEESLDDELFQFANESAAWGVDFQNGDDDWYSRYAEDTKGYARLVRRSDTQPIIKGRYQAIQNGAVIVDKQTGLQWLRCSVGQQWNQELQSCQGEARPYKWVHARKLDESRYDQTGWRLPTREELLTLVYCSTGKPVDMGMPVDWEGCQGQFQRPTIVNTAFPNTPPEGYWTSTRNTRENFSAALVLFNEGRSGAAYQFDPHVVRLVRD